MNQHSKVDPKRRLLISTGPQFILPQNLLKRSSTEFAWVGQFLRDSTVTSYH